MPSFETYLPYLQWIDGQDGRMRSLVEEWANLNSGSTNPEGLKLMQKLLKRAFSPLGDRAEDVRLDPRIAIDTAGNVQHIPTVDGLSVVKRSQAPLKVLLNGHFDTVYGPESPFQHCRHLAEDRLNGPGVADMKGGLVILLIALEALERSPFCQNLGWEVFLNPDEEIGSVGSSSYLQERASHYHLGIIVEPQFSDGAFVSARKGSATYALVAKGRGAHAGRDFHHGINALTALLKPLQRLDSLNAPDSPTTLNIGVMHAGTVVNVVPDLAIAHLNLRASAEEDMHTAMEQIDAIIADAQKGSAAELALHLLTDRGPKPFDAKTQRLFAEVKRCGELLGIAMSWRESGGVCDGNLLAAQGLPTIDSMGAAGGKIHTVEEYIELDRLTLRAKHLALVLMQLATGEMRL